VSIKYQELNGAKNGRKLISLKAHWLFEIIIYPFFTLVS